MSAITRSLRTASRLVRVQPSSLQRAAATPLGRAAKFGAPRSLLNTNTSSLSALNTNSFSTTTARKAAPAMPQEGREYDSEIKDIAEYVNKPIDSELAVSSVVFAPVAPVPEPEPRNARRLTPRKLFFLHDFGVNGTVRSPYFLYHSLTPRDGSCSTPSAAASRDYGSRNALSS